MGILDLFKRKNEFDDLELSKEPPSSYEFGSSGKDTTPTMPGPLGQQQYQDPYAAQGGFTQQGGRDQLVAKELEIISSKLDSIRATLESLNQRISGLERVAYGDQNYGRRY
jgi:hypothetical protein